MGVQFEDEFDLRRLAPGKNAGFGASCPQNYMPLKYSESSVDKKPLRASDLRYSSASNAESSEISRGKAVVGGFA